MLRLIITILLVGAFFILFFKPKYNLKNKTSSNSEAVEAEASTTDGFVEDTQRGPILFGRDGIPPRYGDIGICCLCICFRRPLVKWISAKGC